MDLLDTPLPELRLKIDVDPHAFFDECEEIAKAHSWVIDRRREYAGPGYDQLNLHLGSGPEGYPMIRMVAVPREPQRLRLDLVDHWESWPIDYDEYLDRARMAYRNLLGAIRDRRRKTYRLGIPRRPMSIDYSRLDCSRVRYAAEKLSGLSRSLAVAPGDARDRLINSFWSFHVIRPDDLPEPLRTHLAWVYEEITKRPGRHQREGSVEATVRAMRNTTASRIIERLLDIGDALERLEEHCNRARGGAV
jgi:hypothetical protein